MDAETQSRSRVPLVSALVPTYNGASFITETLEALARQSWPRLEVLVADDHSTDGTYAIAQAHAALHPNVRVIRRSHNMGWIENSNDLMARASGEFMFFAFHDDVLDPAYVETLVKALLAKPEAIMAFSDLLAVRPDGISTPWEFTALGSSKHRLARGLIMASRPRCWWVAVHGVFRAEAFGLIQGLKRNEAGEYGADWPWLLHMALLGDMVRVPTILGRKSVRPDSLSSRWTRDGQQATAWKRSALREVRASRLTLAERVVLLAALELASRLPKPVRLVAARLRTAVGRVRSKPATN